MDLVYIYGPPAAGKYSIAAEVSRRTGYKLFDNHLSITPVEAVFAFGTDPFWRLVHGLRESIMGEAAGAGIDLVFTTVFGNPTSLPQTYRRLEAVESRGGRVCLVRLTCPVPELRLRVGSDQRRAMGKLTRVEALDEMLASADILAPIPDRDSLLIDTSATSVADAAQLIVDHYGLPAA